MHCFSAYFRLISTLATRQRSWTFFVFKKAHLPLQSTRRKRPAVSAEAVEDSDDEVGQNGTTVFAPSKPVAAAADEVEDSGSSSNSSSDEDAVK